MGLDQVGGLDKVGKNSNLNPHIEEKENLWSKSLRLDFCHELNNVIRMRQKLVDQVLEKTFYLV